SLVNSGNNHLISNTANNNTQNGISLTNSSDNVLFNNTARFNHQDGILLNQSSNGNNITENSVCGNLWNGIEVDGSVWNDLVNNSVCSNGRNGILLTNSNNNSLDHNNITRNTLDGINLTNSDSNPIFNNTVSENRGNGISLNLSNNTRLEGNSLTSNIKSGVLVQNSLNDTIINNTIQRNGNGVTFENTNYSFILGNLISDQAGNGITLNTSYSNIIANNTVVLSGKYGIYYNGSGNNLVYNNWFNNDANVKLEGKNLGNNWNIPKTDPYTNIYGGPYLGGNYWAQPDGFGFSQVTPDRGDGFANHYYQFDRNDPDNIDWLPLTNYTPKPPVPPNPNQYYFNPIIPTPDNETWDSKFILDTIPGYMSPCESRNVSITFKNNGTETWTQVVELIPQSNCGIQFIPQRVGIERGVVVNPGENYTFNFTIIAPCANTTCNITARMSRYAYGNYQGIKFGDTAWEVVTVSDQVKQAVKGIPVNTTKVSNSFVSLKERPRNITHQNVTLQRLVTISAGKEPTYLQRNTSVLYKERIADFYQLQNTTSITKNILGVAESRFQTASKVQVAPVYPPVGDISIGNTRKGTETAGYYPNLVTNSTNQPVKSLLNQRSPLNTISPVLLILINAIQ
ncbi:MAG: NosD domain-containing protein, partial [Methanomicrobiales archaeon]